MRAGPTTRPTLVEREYLIRLRHRPAITDFSPASRSRAAHQSNQAPSTYPPYFSLSEERSIGLTSISSSAAPRRLMQSLALLALRDDLFASPASYDARLGAGGAGVLLERAQPLCSDGTMYRSPTASNSIDQRSSLRANCAGYQLIAYKARLLSESRNLPSLRLQRRRRATLRCCRMDHHRPRQIRYLPSFALPTFRADRKLPAVLGPPTQDPAAGSRHGPYTAALDVLTAVWSAPNRHRA